MLKKFVCGLDGKEEKEKWDDKKRVENREGSLGQPGFVKPVFTKESKPLEKRKRSLGYLGSVKSVLHLKKEEEDSFDFQRTSLAGLALDSATSISLGRAPALQCRTPSRHHLELQDRRDYTPADRAARTCCCLGAKGNWESIFSWQKVVFSLVYLSGQNLLSAIERKLLKVTESVAQENINATLGEIKGSNNFAKWGISIDGTLQRRCYSPLNGCVSAISVDTGKSLDIEVMTQYCQICAKGNSQVSKHACSNYKGSAGNMEVIRAYRTFEGSNWYWDRTHDMPAMVGYLNHWATAALIVIWNESPKKQAAQLINHRLNLALKLLER
ncbi:uncharacterized protein TNCV_1954111 [Trichonephila clavipes]|nr:uncharacterized protein TNCV_1954111 [Trichonephila clavipes]